MDGRAATLPAVVGEATPGGKTAATPASVGHGHRVRSGRLGKAPVAGEVVGQPAPAPTTHPLNVRQGDMAALNMPPQTLAHSRGGAVGIAPPTSLHGAQEQAGEGEGEHQPSVNDGGLGVRRPGRGHTWATRRGHDTLWGDIYTNTARHTTQHRPASRGRRLGHGKPRGEAGAERQ